MLKRCDPLRRVLDRARGLDDALVVLAGHARQRRAFAFRVELLRLVSGLGGGALAIARVDRVDVQGQLLAGLVRQATSQGQRVTGLRRAAAPRDAEAHLAPAAARGGVPEDPAGGLATHAKEQTPAVRVVAVAGRQNLPHRELVQVRNDALSGHSGYPIPPVCPPASPPETGDRPLRANVIALRVSSVEQGRKRRQINDLGNFCCVLTASCCALT